MVINVYVCKVYGHYPLFLGQNPLYPGQAVGGAAKGRHDNKDNLNLRF